MELEIVSKKENPLMGRLEVDFTVSHPKENTPKRKEVRDEIASQLKAKKDSIVIDHMETAFGKPETRGYAKIYKGKEEVQRYESEAVLKRNDLFQKKKGEVKAEVKEEGGKEGEKKEE